MHLHAVPNWRAAGAWIPGCLRQARETMCGLRGHDEVLHFERNRVSLRCLTCGHQTPGWTIGPSMVRSQRSDRQKKAA